MPQIDSKPTWLRAKVASDPELGQTMAAIADRTLCTVCVEAHCPNQMNCFHNGNATFLLLGPSCTRRCTFCAVDKTKVSPPDETEPQRIAQAVRELNLIYCVLTMVSRDDLKDGGAGHIKRTVEAIRTLSPAILIELLISDLAGNTEALDMVLDAGPAVLNHNIETVPRLYAQVRPQADYRRSLMVLDHASRTHPDVVTKSGIMLGLGETKAEVITVMSDLRNIGCRLLTIGQYLAPSQNHHPVVRYVHPDEFSAYKQEALSMGFDGVASAPLVRSSYKAGELYQSTAH